MNKARNWGLLAVLAFVGYVMLDGDTRHRFGNFVVSLAKPILIPVVETILEPTFIYTTSLLIVVAGLLSCVVFFFRVVGPALVRMRSLQAETVRLRRSQKTYPQEASLAIDALGEALRQRSLYAFSWASFRRQMVLEQRVPEHPFSSFAADDPTADSIDGDDLMDALPGYFVSVGLILTFSGLVVALYFAAKGFRAGDMAQAQEAILQLLNASAFKFITSIAALASALLITVFHGFCRSLIRSERTRTVATIEQCISEFRAAEVTSLGPVSNGRDETAAQIGMLTEAISRLNAEVSRLSSSIAAAGLDHAIEK